jgi:predicted acyl esterase
VSDQVTAQIPVAYRTPKSPDDPTARIPPFTSSSEILRAGTVHAKGGIALGCDILVERGVRVPLRDGVAINVDVFRPTGAADLPAIVAWSPYGNRGGAVLLSDFPLRAGVPQHLLSGLEKFEGPDPAYWCQHGYAVVNADARGVGDADGDIAFWGTQEGRDGADLIEWVGTQPWSNGKVGMSGNSWLALVQWYVAAEQPSHLAAIAPWEGTSDLYRDTHLRGGIRSTGFCDYILSTLAGRGRLEDPVAMARTHPLMNTYWEDRTAKPEKIVVPAYVVASWTNLLHTRGTLDAFRRLASREKWLRVHNTMEWPDYYTPRSRDDLRRFFDRFLRQIDNGWDSTPPVRLSVLDPGHTDDVDRVEAEWPPARFEHRKLYLDAATGTLRESPAAPSEARYQADKPSGRATFVHTFSADTELVGHSNLVLWVQADGGDDMDLFVQIQKLSRRGRLLLSRTIPMPNIAARLAAPLAVPLKHYAADLVFYKGPTGQLRASHRALDPTRSTPSEPVLSHLAEDPLPAGRPTRVEIGLWPTGLRFHKGEQLRLVISGTPLVRIPIPGVEPPEVHNRGVHVIHTGGATDSFLLVPLGQA